MALASRRFPAECPHRTSNEGAPKDTSTNGSREYGRPMNFPPPYGDMHGAGRDSDVGVNGSNGRSDLMCCLRSGTS